MKPSVIRPLAGVATILVLAGIIGFAIVSFRSGLTTSVPVTALSSRAGLVMNPDAKVKLHGVQVGKVESIESLPDGQAALHLAIDPTQLHLIPANTLVDIASTTVFGAKSVELVPPPDPSAASLSPGQILDARNVMVETNTVFQQLNDVLGAIDPIQLNATLSALAQSFNGRGGQLGQALSDFNAFLGKIEPGLPALRQDLEMAPQVVGAYADAAPDLVTIAANTTRISQTLVDEQQSLDRILISAIGLADVGNDVVGGNRESLSEVLRLLVPTTALTNQYHENLGCSLAGIVPMLMAPPPPDPGVPISVSFTLGVERYRYPQNLPKVAATSPSLCASQQLPNLPPEVRPPFVVADIGANPFQYGNQGILLNSDALKQALFGPIDGPPRNTAQIGQPG